MRISLVKDENFAGTTTVHSKFTVDVTKIYNKLRTLTMQKKTPRRLFKEIR